MNKAKLDILPSHIQHVRAGKMIHSRVDDGWRSMKFDSIASAKRHVRTEIGCKGGPKSPVRTAESLGLAGEG